MNKQDLKSKIEKLEKGIASKVTPENLKASLKSQKEKFEKELVNLEKKEKSDLSKKIKDLKASVKTKSTKSALSRDGARKAKKSGKRIAEDGSVYYEKRANRTDSQTKKKPYLEEGGYMNEGGDLESFEKKVKDAMKNPNKWYFMADYVGDKKVQLKMFVGVKEVDVQIFKIDGIHAKMPRNYSNRRDTLKMIMDNFEPKMAKGGEIEDKKLNETIKQLEPLIKKSAEITKKQAVEKNDENYTKLRDQLLPIRNKGFDILINGLNLKKGQIYKYNKIDESNIAFIEMTHVTEHFIEFIAYKRNINTNKVDINEYTRIYHLTNRLENFGVKDFLKMFKNIALLENDEIKWDIMTDEYLLKSDKENKIKNEEIEKNNKKELAKDWFKFIKDNKSYFNIYEETEDMIHLNTREHGNVGDEQYGVKDVQFAKDIYKKVKEKYPNTKGKMYTIDEWVDLELTFVPNDKMAKGGLIKIGVSDIEDSDFQSLSQIFESNDAAFSIDESEEYVLMDLKGFPDGDEKEEVLEIIGKYDVQKMADGGKLDKDISDKIDQDLKLIVTKKEKYEKELKELKDSKSEDKDTITYLEYELESLHKLYDRLSKIKNQKMAKGGDLYDDMDEDIEFANKKAKMIANSLKGMGYNIVEFTEADYDADANISLSENVNVNVDLEGELAIVTDEGDGKFLFMDCGKSYATVLEKLKKLEDKGLVKRNTMDKMEKGGKAPRTIKLTLSDKDSYDYTYKQDGTTGTAAEITFGFGKEPFQYEVKKISKSLEPLKQDILDAFTIQGIKQHEYKGGFSEAIKHLDTKVVYEDNFAKGGSLNDGKWIAKRNIGFGTNYKEIEDGDKIRMDLGSGKYYNGVIKGNDVLWEDGEKSPINKLFSNGVVANSIYVFRMAEGGETMKSNYEKGGYVIVEGVDHYKNKPLYKVVSKDEDNEYVGDWHESKEDAENELEYFQKNKMAKGGTVKYYDKDNEYKIGRPSGYIEKEILERVSHNEQEFVGSFGWKTSMGKMAEGYLYNLNDFDRNLVNDIKLKQGEKIFRYLNRTTAIGGMRPFIKINVDKTLLYFLVNLEDDGIEFETKGIQANYIALIAHKMEQGGYMADGGMTGANKKIKDFYIENYPMDELGIEINEKSTFNGLYKVLDNQGDVYHYIGVSDSLVRERVFEKLADMMGVKYDEIYQKWLDSDYADGGMMAKGGEVGDNVKFKSGMGYWDVTKYPYGGDFKRLNGSEEGVIVSGTRKRGDEIRVKLNDGRTILVNYRAVDLPEEQKDELLEKNKHLFTFGYADGGSVGQNMYVFGYTTQNFDLCPLAVEEFVKAVDVIGQTDSDAKKTALSRAAMYVDDVLGVEKKAKEDNIVSKNEFLYAVNQSIVASAYNYASGLEVNLNKFLPMHIFEIAAKLVHTDQEARKDELTSYDMFVAKGVMGDAVFNNMTQDERRNLAMELKQKKSFEDGGSIEESNYRMVVSQAKAIKHHADELLNVLTPNIEVEAWVVGKIERASTDLSDITHYIDGLNGETEEFVVVSDTYFAEGGKLEKGVYYLGKPKKEGEVWGQKIVELDENGLSFATDYARKLKDFPSKDYKKISEEELSEFIKNSPKHHNVSSDPSKFEHYANGGMIAGRWYRDNQGVEYRYIGEDSTGQYLFSDGQKVSGKSLDDFESDTKEKKLFKWFKEGGAIDDRNARKNKTYYMVIWDKNNVVDSEYFDNEEDAVKKFDEVVKDKAILANLDRIHFNEYGWQDEMFTIKFHSDKMEQGGYMAKGGTIAVRNEGVDEYSEFNGKKRYGVEIQDEDSEDVLDYEYFDSEEEAEEFINKYAKGGYMAQGGELNLGIRKMAQEEGFTPKELGKEYELTMAQAVVEALTDANYHDAARKLVSLLEKNPKMAIKPNYPNPSDPKFNEKFEAINKEYDSKYWEADDKTRNFAIKVSQKSGWDGYAIAGAFEYLVRVDGGYHKLADNIEKAMESSDSMAKGGGIYSSDSLYYLQVLKDGEEVGREKFRAKSLKEAREIAEDDYEKDYQSKFGDHLSFIVSEAMAEGGMTEHGLRIGDKVTTDMFWDNQIVVENQKTHKRAQINLETGQRKDEMAKGGEVKVGDVYERKGFGKLKITKIDDGKFRKVYFKYDDNDKELFEGMYGAEGKIANKQWVKVNDKMAKGGKVTFEDKVKSIKASLLKKKKVSPKVQKDYGKTYSPKEAEQSAKRIVGSMTKKGMK